MIVRPPGDPVTITSRPFRVTMVGLMELSMRLPGGRTIINTVNNILLNVLEYDMDARAAVDAPRHHHQWLPDTVTFESSAIPDSTAQRLQAMGHGVRVRGGQGDAHTILFDSKRRVYIGANDFRSADSKVSVP